MMQAGSDRLAAEACRRLGAGWTGVEAAVVLGSGLGSALPPLETARTADYTDVPGLGACGVDGHPGRLTRGRFGSREVLFFQGRRHLYEGLTMAEAAFPARLASVLGARLLVLCSAVGAVDPDLPVGAWVFVEDHINLMGRNPLEGVSTDQGPPFVDLSRTYRRDRYPELARRLTGEGTSYELERGVLAAFAGPSYETPAEVRMARILGARVVGMSIVPEAVWGRFLGLDVLAFGHVSNPAAGVVDRPLEHREVLERARKGAEQVPLLVAAALAAASPHHTQTQQDQ